MNSAPPCLAVDRVHAWRGERHVLKGVSLTLLGGELLHVWGPNGTGKTTLLRVVCGLLRPEQGTVAWSGRPITAIRAEFHASLAYASHEPALKGDLTALENLRFAVGLRRRVADGELLASLERTDVLRCAELPVRVLSAGQKRRVAMARVLAMQSPLWLLDEPFTNLDQRGAELVSDLLLQHVAAGGLAMVVAHQELRLATAVRRMELDG